MRVDLTVEIDPEFAPQEWRAPHRAGAVVRGGGATASIDIDPSGNTLALAAGAWAGLVRLQSLETMHRLAGVSEAAPVTGKLFFFADGRRVAAYVDGADPSLRVWESSEGDELDRIRGDDVGPVVSASAGGKRILVRSAESKTAAWNTDDWTVAARTQLGAPAGLQALSPDGASHLCNTRDAVREVTRIFTTEGSPVPARRTELEAAAFLPLGKEVLLKERGLPPALVRVASRDLAPHAAFEAAFDPAFPADDTGATVMAIDPWTRCFALFSPGRAAFLTRFDDGRALAFATPRNITAACFTPDGRQLFAAGGNGLLRGWTVDVEDPPR